MIPAMEEEKKVVLFEENREMEEDDDEEEEESVEDGSASEEDDDDGDSEPEDGSDETGAEKVEDSPQSLDKTKEDAPGEKKPPGSLNVNNEVVKMRKEVKRVRALIIRKLTRQIGNLKKKKGKEADIERNQRRAGRLLEEIHTMKALRPDKVTKTALQKNLSFEQECKNPKSTVEDRAIARIATHPQFNKKIQDIKAAVADFKAARKRGGKGKEASKAGKAAVQLDQKKDNNGVNQKDSVVREEKPLDVEEGETEPKKESRTVIQPAEKTVCNNNNSKKAEMPQVKTVRAAMTKSTEVKNVRNASKMKEKSKAEPEEESDLDSSGDEEKEYFDDSTEERFHKQSSHSEESDEGDDFFVGKVSKFKKKKKQKDAAKTDQTEEEERSRREKVTSLDSIFCTSLARSRPGRGAGRGRLGGRGRGGSREAFSKQSRLQGKPSQGERGRGRGRGGAPRKTDHRDGSSVPAEPALHPSWEASKKRKEQQGQILAFQGKKIKFDDD